ncbi:DUF1028 domain-containing protein [Antarctobacter heliothermus]|uniref:Uncharacterized conserved protein, Ntn-hydrolase superfamily n=1 Tax=Antarctobacter heliothermus TaxID=74033 RepID=A0A239JHI1_9RHOB|nr:DUF1028 domain-containing protein [Antarctobacter heliothermus]SNT05280.1 Uncharacterized conserved protein, Ntn-hydrolase superfamily [Antarctobacter heliothermus]
MTISILAYDEKSGRYGGAATTGSLCVGGWVLRGDAESGMSASQGSLPSTMWGTDTLTLMKAGTGAQAAVDQVTGADSGRGQRQLATLDTQGGVGHFTGADSIAVAGARHADRVIVTGNLLSSEAVLDAALDGYLGAQGLLDLRLMAALDAAFAAGGDSRGLLSAALLIVGRDMAPRTLRVDYSPTPLDDLRALHTRATSGDYADWSVLVPTLAEPERAVPYGAKTDQPV